MVSVATTSRAFVISTYDRDGRIGSSSSAEPVPRDRDTSDGSTVTADAQDTVTLSDNGIEQSRRDGDPGSKNNTASTATDGAQATGPDEGKTGVAGQTLTPAEEKVLQQLKTRDQEVKTHEMAHLANAGPYARGGPTYTYQQGPDGQRYAIGGEVPIDVSKEKTPELTLQKMEAVRRAAMAPADPSSADRSIAAAAAAMETQARQEIQAARTNTAHKQATSGTYLQTTGQQTVNNTSVASNSSPTQPLDLVA